MPENPDILEKKYQALQKEFTNFTYVVSHDLSGPIRHFREFSKLLFEAIESHMTDDTRQYKHFLEKSVITLETKLDVILKISRVNTGKWHPVVLNSKELITSAVNNLLVIRDFDFSFDGDFPSMNVDFESSYTVFYNVLSNAIKFTDDMTRPSVKIQCTRTNKNEVKFQISDNGIGIPESKIDSVFEIFKRLSHKYDGEGAGLTLAQKIMSRYEGEISISSVVDKGTEVTLIFPNREELES
ncbi:MAG: HAMP domain-containing histidine kinase [Lentisphaeraceae bacterium]|nr:HAMP domain-containing histidine kinase [Lentisphaeraceae bacterium]